MGGASLGVAGTAGAGVTEGDGAGCLKVPFLSFLDGEGLEDSVVGGVTVVIVAVMIGDGTDLDLGCLGDGSAEVGVDEVDMGVLSVSPSVGVVDDVEVVVIVAAASFAFFWIKDALALFLSS